MHNVSFLWIFSKLEQAVNRRWTSTEAKKIKKNVLPENEWIMESVMNSFYCSPGESTPLMLDWICYWRETWDCGIFGEAIFFSQQWVSFYSPLIKKGGATIPHKTCKTTATYIQLRQCIAIFEVALSPGISCCAIYIVELWTVITKYNAEKLWVVY